MKELKVDILGGHKLEKDFTTDWLRSLEKKDFTTDKISDWSIWYKKIDCYIWTNKWYYVCEIKVIKKDVFKISQLRANQISFLRKTLKTVWKPIVTVYSIEYDNYVIIPFEYIKDMKKEDSITLKFN
mgnify:CR=1 FL=1